MNHNVLNIYNILQRWSKRPLNWDSWVHFCTFTHTHMWKFCHFSQSRVFTRVLLQFHENSRTDFYTFTHIRCVHDNSQKFTIKKLKIYYKTTSKVETNINFSNIYVWTSIQFLQGKKKPCKNRHWPYNKYVIGSKPLKPIQ